MSCIMVIGVCHSQVWYQAFSIFTATVHDLVHLAVSCVLSSLLSLV